MSMSDSANRRPARMAHTAGDTAPLRPLRVAFFVNEFPALSETFVLNQVIGVMARGHHATVFAIRPRADPFVHPQVAHANIRRIVRYIGAPSGKLVRIFNGGLRLPGALRREPRITIRSIDPFRYGRDAVSLRLFYAAAKLAQEPPFDILHCHFGPIGAMVAVLRDIGAIEGRLITTFHGVDVSAYVREDADRYRMLFSRGDLFMPISDSWGRRLALLGCDPDRIAVHRMGVDLKRLAYQSRKLAANKPLRILTVGRLVEKKGIEILLAALAELRQANIRAHYSIVGDGPLRDSLNLLAKNLGIADHVTFHGWQPHDSVIKLMYEHDVLVAPSITSTDGDQEGIPVTLIEGMASGLPVISTFHSGIPELIHDGISGVLVPERDPDALAAALLRISSQPSDFYEMANRARHIVEREYDLDALNDRLIWHYRRTLDRNAVMPS